MIFMTKKKRNTVVPLAQKAHHSRRLHRYLEDMYPFAWALLYNPCSNAALHPPFRQTSSRVLKVSLPHCVRHLGISNVNLIDLELAQRPKGSQAHCCSISLLSLAFMGQEGFAAFALGRDLSTKPSRRCVKAESGFCEVESSQGAGFYAMFCVTRPELHRAHLVTIASWVFGFGL